MMKALILCGGLSTRLGDITKSLPKILLDIAGKTVLERQIEMLAAAGVDEVYLASGHLHEELEKAVGSEVDGMPIKYVQEHKKLGTGGAIKNGLNHIGSYPVIVLNGDILLETSLKEMGEALTPDMEGLLLAVEVPDARSYGRLIFDENVLHIERFVEKDPTHEGPGYINGGIYIFNKGVESYFPEEDAFSIEYNVFPHVKKLHAFPYKGVWIDIGTPERLSFAREELFVNR